MSDGAQWKLYERVVAALKVEEHASIEMSVQANAKIKGLSGTLRQIDVLIDARFDGGFKRRIIVDAKNYTGKLDINDVEKFHGMMIDCSASRGILVCKNGWSDAALRRAGDYIGLSLLGEENVDEYIFYMTASNCYACDKGVAFIDNDMALKIENLWNIFRIGKCDKCHAFYIWCWGCGEHFSIKDGDDVRCSCNYCWYVSPPDPDGDEERDELEPLSAYLLLAYETVDFNGTVKPNVLRLDRRRGA